MSVSRNAGLRFDVEDKHERKSGITVRSVVVSVAALFVATYLVAYGDGFKLTTPMAAERVPSVPAFAVVIILLFVSFLTKRFGKQLGITKQELVVIYIALAFGGIIPVLVFGQVANLIGRYSFNLMSKPSEWEPVVGHLRGLLVPVGDGVARGFFTGSDEGVPWGAWIVPCLIWLCFFAVMLIMCMAVVTFFREQWDKREHLTFPIASAVQLVIDIEEPNQAGESKGSFGEVPFWIGAAIPIILTGLGLLHQFMPFVPVIPTSWNVGQFFSEGTFQSGLFMWPTLIFSFNPIATGIAYLLALDLSFSAWFFWIVLKAGNIVSVARGTMVANWSFLKSHTTGAYMGLALFLIWINRVDIVRMIHNAFRKEADSEEGLREARFAVFGTFIPMIVIVLFLTVVIGITFWLSLVYVLVFLSGVIAFARVRAEVGVPSSVAIPHKIPSIVKEIFGPERIDTVQLARLGSVYSIVEFGSAGALALEGFRMADKSRMKRSSVYWALVMGLVASFIFAARFMLPLYYEYGSVMGNAYLMQTATLSTDEMIKSSAEGTGIVTNTLVVGGSVVSGALIAALLMFMRTKFLWWPFHPLGYALGWQYDVGYAFWSSFFIAWLIKTIVLRYGGNYLYKKTLSLAYGLILGGVFMQFLSAAIGLLKGLLG